MGRPTLYREEYDQQAFKLCLLGATNQKLADFFDVNVSSIDEWLKVHPGFSSAVKKGRADADAVIAKSLFHRARGYSHPEDKIFNDGGRPLIVPTTKHYPPDTVAAIFWLKNRQPAQWRDKQEVSVEAKVESRQTFDFSGVPMDDLTKLRSVLEAAMKENDSFRAREAQEEK